MYILNFTTLVVLIAMLCAFVSSHPSPTDLLSNDPIAMESQLRPAGNDSLTAEEALQGNHLAARQSVDLLPLPPDCKKVFKSAIPASKAAFAWIKKTICEEYKCKVAFAPAYKKYSIDPIKKHIIMEWIFGTFQKRGHPIQKLGIDPGKVFDKIVKKCIEGNPKIMGAKNICTASEESYKDIKSCIIGEVMEYVPKVGLWAKGACKIALQEKMVEKPDWRVLVKDFKHNKLCEK
ncbi:hypothetical protein N7537_004006 [Penicillium hordei]|uniref:Uncharacterized protein n=1 Tax=Penicillium hordei TaxID=40994 RepID=A0AAD6EBS1_9EURO|nr:uncharacterized protein N7537_004006 [Penicillium hordei]KAJ5607387.1 hypothetical protein N7537_004006 [Penicillium hordei]